MSILSNLSVGVGCPGFVSVDYCNSKIAGAAALCGRRDLAIIILSCCILGESIAGLFLENNKWLKN